VDVGLIGRAKLNLREAEGDETSLALAKNVSVYSITLHGTGTRLIQGIAGPGLTQRGRDFVLVAEFALTPIFAVTYFRQ